MLCSSIRSELMRITAKSPCRVDLAGATLDIWPLYLFHATPVTVNFAVDRYTSCTLETRDDSRIVLSSRDLKLEESFESLAAMREAKKYKLRLLVLLVDFSLRKRASRWNRNRKPRQVQAFQVRPL